MIRTRTSSCVARISTGAILSLRVITFRTGCILERLNSPPNGWGPRTEREIQQTLQCEVNQEQWTTLDVMSYVKSPLQLSRRLGHASSNSH